MDSDDKMKLNRAKKALQWILLITMENVLHLLDEFNSPIYAYSGIRL